MSMERYCLDWWAGLFRGRAEHLAELNLVAIEMRRTERDGTPEEVERLSLAESFDPNAVVYATFMAMAITLTQRGLISPAEVTEIAEKAGELSAAQQVFGRGPGLPDDLTPKRFREASVEAAREMIDQAMRGRFDEHMKDVLDDQESGPDRRQRS